uniref:Uncharacterized protein n=1 Tax=Thermogemmatispora argillosa TaxID=2045280 RepID=A0A455T1Y7_9CHLR|nr:hypothetical protein KTA_15680 [Thermogemmatispora argillosa]
MLTFEDVTGFFLKAAAEVGLTAHPEYWINSRTMEREFACTCHIGSCEQVENSSICTVSFSWGSLDTALSLEGPRGVCDFFHEPHADCPHLRTREIPALVLDLSYSLSLKGTAFSEETLLSLTQMLRLRASEHSSRTIETRPGVTLTLQDHRLVPESLTLQQRVELPIWHPEGLRGLHESSPYQYSGGHALSPSWSHRYSYDEEEEEEGEAEIVADDPHPEEWLPRVMVDVCQDIVHVLEALSAVCSLPD